MRINVLSLKGTSVGEVFSCALRTYLHQNKDLVKTVDANSVDFEILVNGFSINVDAFAQTLSRKTDLSRVSVISDSIRNCIRDARDSISAMPSSRTVEQEVRDCVHDQLSGFNINDHIDFGELYSSSASSDGDDATHSVRESLNSLERLITDGL